MYNTESLSHALMNVQAACIGLYRPYGSNKDDWQLIVEKEGALIVSLKIGTLFGLQEDHCTTTYGIVVLFPEGKTLWDMMQDVYGFKQWYDTHCGTTPTPDTSDTAFRHLR